MRTSSPAAPSTASGVPAPARSGFTLVELMVAVGIIAILAAILLPAIGEAFVTARTTQVVAEIQLMEKGLLDFKAKYGVDPPSSFLLCETPTDYLPTTDLDGDPNTTSAEEALRNESFRTIRRMFPAFEPTAGSPIDFSNSNADEVGNASDDRLFLNGSECLVFFLGGIFDDQNIAPIGFSRSQTFPFTQTLSDNRDKFMEFDGQRFVDIDGDGMREYIDQYEGQTTPYVYLSSYGGTGYRLGGLDQVPVVTAAGTVETDKSSGLDNETPTLISAATALDRESYIGPLFPYVKLVQPDGAGDSQISNPATTKLVWNESTYQIISPGEDGIFGRGGVWSPDGGLQSEQAQTTDNVATATEDQRDTGVEADNVTNFSAGRLN